jgi:prevent-host-death family protein
MCVHECYAGGMAETVSVREFRHNLASYLERAHSGEEIVITRAGRVDAQLGPVPPGVETRSVTAANEEESVE